jgi:uncharacterized protein (TIGR03437 family)
VNAKSNPATAGSVISVFFTGQGPVSSAVDDGAAPPAGQTVTTSLQASATIGGMAAQVQFAGLAPQYAGVAQMNVKIPVLASGVYPLLVNIGGKASNAGQVAVRGQ